MTMGTLASVGWLLGAGVRLWVDQFCQVVTAMLA